VSFKLSLIIPVYNRPQEVEELLESLCQQTEHNFEVILVEDGSAEKSEFLIPAFEPKLELSYYFKTNSGPGLSRNYGAQRANGDYYIFLDSDCVLPEHYIASVNKALAENAVAVFGGPDRAHANFTPIQKAINYAMTAFLTTGGIRGGKASMEKFHPRSFNMGMSKAAFAKTNGFANMRFGEDIDLSIRIVGAGFTSALFADAYVYHKRRTNFRQFFKQVYNSGIARINLHKRHPGTLKLVHFFPGFFVLGFLLALITALLGWYWLLACYGIYFTAVFVSATISNKSLKVGLLSIVSSFVQLSSYGLGFWQSFYRRIILGKPEFSLFTRNFYK
jgi:glycosyltransferase involved in cell wall biosynthesis